mmetsp:Transcript_20993/g.53810  ORF Transcript_20993/g.53810 Transcript_20993/m.53810 type:complete len:224 (-) Transcript_20993:31-702(-)
MKAAPPTTRPAVAAHGGLRNSSAAEKGPRNARYPASRSAATRAPMVGSVHHKMRPFVSMANPPIKSPARTASLSLLLPWSSLPPPPPGEPPPPPEPPLPTSPPPPVQALAVDRRPGLGRCCRYPGLPSAALCDGGATGRLWGGWAKRLGARRAGQRALEAGKLRLAALSVPAPPAALACIFHAAAAISAACSHRQCDSGGLSVELVCWTTGVGCRALRCACLL